MRVKPLDDCSPNTVFGGGCEMSGRLPFGAVWVSQRRLNMARLAAFHRWQ